MLYKQDWEEAKQQMLAWWRFEPVDRPMLVFTTPRAKPLSCTPASQPVDDRQRRLDFDAVLARAEERFAKTAYLGECFPYVTADLGPGSANTFLGCEPMFDANTVWYEPAFDSPQSARIRLDESNPWWQWTLKATQHAVARAEGKYLVAIPDLIENLDTLAALLGTSNLLYALKDCPQEIHRLQQELAPVWDAIFERLYQIISPRRNGNSFMAFNIWGDGKTAKLQCDFSAMISAEMFAEFVVPYMNQQIAHLDYVLYHLDGPCALQHLDLLCGMPGINAIQWMPGDGQAPADDPCWDRVYRRTLDAGKGIMLYISAKRAADFVKKWGKRGVYLLVGGIQSEAEGREFIKSMAR
jgi:5-methyltetrahydrofolate--homocysteine methyltransferase